MTEISSGCLEVILKRHAFLSSISKVVEIIDQPGTKVGRNYLSNSQRIVFKALKGNGEESENSVLAKLEPSTSSTKDYCWQKGAFTREMKMYREVLPNMKYLLESCGDFSDPLWPECLSMQNYTTIILEDVTRLGYRTSTFHCLDFEHSLLAICALAKFHATSLVLKERHLLDEKDFGEYWFLNYHPLMEGRFSENLKILAKSIKSSWDKEWQSLATAIEAVSNDVIGSFRKYSKKNSLGFDLLIHGDLWLTNMMFKYCPFTNKVIGMRFVDFQTVYYGSYAFDLTFLIHSTISSSVRNENLDVLISAYHETLENSFRTLGFRPVNVPTKKDIDLELKKNEVFGIILSLSLLNFHIAEIENVCFTQSETPSFMQSIFHSERYKKNAQDLLRPYLKDDIFNENWK